MQKVNSSMALPKKGVTPLQRIWILLALSLLSIILYMTVNLGSNLAYILPHRGYIVLTMVVVAFAAGVSTVLFQTVANNKILTPSIMGLEYYLFYYKPFLSFIQIAFLPLGY